MPQYSIQVHKNVTWEVAGSPTNKCKNKKIYRVVTDSRNALRSNSLLKDDEVGGGWALCNNKDSCMHKIIICVMFMLMAHGFVLWGC